MIEHSPYRIAYEKPDGSVISFRHHTGVDFTILSKILLKYFSEEKHIIELVNYNKDMDLVEDCEPHTNLEGIISPLLNFQDSDLVISVNNRNIKIYPKTPEEHSGDFFSGLFPDLIPIFVFTTNLKKWEIELNDRRIDLEHILYLKDKYHKYLIYETMIEDYIKVADPNYRPKMATGDYKPLTWEDVKEKVWLLDFKRDKRCYQIINYLDTVNIPALTEYFITEYNGNWEHIKKSSDSHKLYRLNKKLTTKYLNEPTTQEFKKKKI